MGSLRYSEGGVTVTLDGTEMEDLVRRALDAAAGETVRVMEAAAQEVANDAQRDWYAAGTGVTRRTGRSGNITVITTVSDDEVRVSVGSTDTDLVRNARGALAPRAAVVRRPGPLSLVDELVDQGTWWEWKKARKPVGKPGTAGEKNWTIRVPNPNASDGKFLVQELIRKPMRVKVRVVTPELGRAIAARASRR
jgi:hypothetical protein